MIVGGLRARLLKESLFHMINDSLAQLGWFDAGRQHQAVTFRAHAVDDDETITVNMVALADEDLVSDEIELGTLLSEHRWTFYVDVYAENDSIGIHLSHDIKSILEGRMPAIGRGNNRLMIIDYTSTSATPSIIAYADIDEVSVQKAHGFTKPWQKHWYSVPMLVTDYYADSGDTGVVTMAGSSTRVYHGTNANFPRPGGFDIVEWIGEVEPINALDNDVWFDLP